MPRTGGQAKREKIVRSAADLFRKKTYHSVSINDILRACRISKGTFYFYFDSKQELANAVVDYYAEYVPAVARRCFDGASWCEGVDRLMRHFVGPSKHPRPFGAPIANLGLEVAHTNPSLLASIAKVLRNGEKGFTSLLSERGMPAPLARKRGGTIVAVFEGSLARFAMTKDVLYAERAARQIKALGRNPREATDGGKRRRAVRTRAATAAAMCADIFEKITLDSVDDRSIIKHRGSSMAARNDAAEKRLKILRTAAAQFGRKGYHATALDDILKTCGVPKGSFHFYFAGKTALAAAVVKHYGRRCRMLMEMATARGGWPDAVEVLCAVAERSGNEPWETGCPLGNMGMELAGVSKTLGQRVESIFEDIENRFAGGFRGRMSEAEARERAGYAVALWQGHVTRMIIYGDPGIVGQLREDLLELAG